MLVPNFAVKAFVFRLLRAPVLYGMRRTGICVCFVLSKKP
jgi:hypothetical protein